MILVGVRVLDEMLAHSLGGKARRASLERELGGGGEFHGDLVSLV